MDFNIVDNHDEHRGAAHDWALKHLRSDWVYEQYQTSTNHTPALHALLAREGILGAGWPREYGGSLVDPGFASAVFDEISDAGLYGDGWATTNMVIRTIDSHGSERQKREIISAALSGDVIIALGYSEPDSGSDVAAAKTRAVRDGDEWVIDGQKIFTSSAHFSSHIFLLTRTNLDVPKHKGLTMFLVPTSAPGFDVQPIHTLGGPRINATFFSGVRVSDSLRVGKVDDGWHVMRTALMHERAGSKGMAKPALALKVAAWAQSARRQDGSTYYNDPMNRERLARIAIDEEVGRLLGLRVRAMIASGDSPGVEGSMTKLFTSEAAQRHYSELLNMLGAEGVLQPSAADAALHGELEAHFRSSVVRTIYGGASEIQRDIIAESRLGLPRSRPRDW